MKYAWMREQEGEHAVRAMCRALALSPSGYYAWRSRKPSQRDQANTRLAQAISQIHVETRQHYGAEKMWEELRDRGYCCGRHRVARLRRRHGIVTKRRRRFIRARKPYDRTPPAPRLVKWPFITQVPNQVWASDITFIPTARGWLHLAVVIDHCTRLIVGWSMHHRQDRHMVVRAVQMAVWQREGDNEVILHSDRGGQFISGTYQNYLGKNALVSSMSAVGHCGDNAACEGFFGVLKRERVHRANYWTRDEARADLFDYLERFHNPRMRRRVARRDRAFQVLIKPSVETG